MSPINAIVRFLGVVLVIFLGFTLAGCGSSSGDPGAERSDQQSQDLRNRINSTQIDR